MEFDKLAQKTIRQNSSHADIIRSLRNIEDTKQYLGDASEEFNKNLTKMSLYSDDTHSTNPVFGDDDSDNFTETPEDHHNRITMSSAIPHDHVNMAVRDLIELGIFVKNNEDLKSLMVNLAEQVAVHVFDIFVDFMRSYFIDNGGCISEILNEHVPFECVFETALNLIRDSAVSSRVDIGQYIESTDSKYLRSKINEFYNRQRMRHELRGRPTEHCKNCFGTYYVQKKETV